MVSKKMKLLFVPRDHCLSSLDKPHDAKPGFKQASLCKIQGFFNDFLRLSRCFQGMKAYEKYWFTHQNSTLEMLHCVTKDISL